MNSPIGKSTATSPLPGGSGDPQYVSMPVTSEFQSAADAQASCPYCLEPIRAGASLCKHCRSDLRGVPATPTPRPLGVMAPAAPPTPQGRSSPSAYRSYLQAQISCIRKYATFRGRATRSEFWYFNLSLTLCNIVPAILYGDAPGYETISLIFNLVFLMPQLAVAVRRLHDTNRSGLWLLLSLTGVGLIPLLFWWAKASNPTANRFGPAAV
jgi:uncharacterized membrane protein YhaH (DUF805 family)